MAFIAGGSTGGGGKIQWETVQEAQVRGKILGVWDLGPQMKKKWESTEEYQVHACMIGVDVDPNKFTLKGEPVTAFAEVNLRVHDLEKAGVTDWLKLMFPGETVDAIQSKWNAGVDLEGLVGRDCTVIVKHSRSIPNSDDQEPFNSFRAKGPQTLMEGLEPLPHFFGNPDQIPEIVERKRKRTIGGWEAYAQGRG